MTVESEPGKGATFNIYLPASPGKAAEKRTAEELPAKGTGKILLMDDEEVVRNTAAEMLRYLGYEVELAEDGAQAIERYREARDSARPFDAVIMDLTVPGGMGGREAIQKLHETAPGARVIVSSGYSSDPVLANYAAYGFCGIVTKPYKVSELSEAVHKALLPQK
jgi:CheY-like chemotaxis protein